MKTLALLALLSVSGCVAVPITVGIYKGSQLANEATGGEAGRTLTSQDGEACEKGDEAACNRCLAYSAALGAYHCTVWAEIDKALPTISEKKDNYGGAKYWAAQENYKGEQYETKNQICANPKDAFAFAYQAQRGRAGITR